MASKKTVFVGAWRAHAVNDLLLRQINSQLPNKKGVAALLTLSTQGLHMDILDYKGNVTKRDLIQLENIVDFIDNKYNTRCTLAIIRNRQLKHYTVCVFVCKNEKDAAALIRTFKQSKKHLTGEGYNVELAPSGKNWTLATKTEEENSKHDWPDRNGNFKGHSIMESSHIKHEDNKQHVSSHTSSTEMLAKHGEPNTVQVQHVHDVNRHVSPVRYRVASPERYQRVASPERQQRYASPDRRYRVASPPRHYRTVSQDSRPRMPSPDRHTQFIVYPANPQAHVHRSQDLASHVQYMPYTRTSSVTSKGSSFVRGRPDPRMQLNHSIQQHLQYKQPLRLVASDPVRGYAYSQPQQPKKKAKGVFSFGRTTVTKNIEDVYKKRTLRRIIVPPPPETESVAHYVQSHSQTRPSPNVDQHQSFENNKVEIRDKYESNAHEYENEVEIHAEGARVYVNRLDEEDNELDDNVIMKSTDNEIHYTKMEVATTESPKPEAVTVKETRFSDHDVVISRAEKREHDNGYDDKKGNDDGLFESYAKRPQPVENKNVEKVVAYRYHDNDANEHDKETTVIRATEHTVHYNRASNGLFESYSKSPELPAEDSVEKEVTTRYRTNDVSESSNNSARLFVSRNRRIRYKDSEAQHQRNSQEDQYNLDMNALQAYSQVPDVVIVDSVASKQTSEKLKESKRHRDNDFEQNTVEVRSRQGQMHEEYNSRKSPVQSPIRSGVGVFGVYDTSSHRYKENVNAVDDPVHDSYHADDDEINRRSPEVISEDEHSATEQDEEENEIVSDKHSDVVNDDEEEEEYELNMDALRHYSQIPDVEIENSKDTVTNTKATKLKTRFSDTTETYESKQFEEYDDDVNDDIDERRTSGTQKKSHSGLITGAAVAGLAGAGLAGVGFAGASFAGAGETSNGNEGNVTNMFAGIKETINGAGNELQSGVANAGEVLNENVDDLQSGLSNVGGTLDQNVNNLASGIENAERTLSGGVGGVTSGFEGATATLTDGVDNLKNDITEGGSALRENVAAYKDDFEGNVEELKSKLANAGDGVDEKIGELTSGFSNTADETIQDVDEDLENGFNKLTQMEGDDLEFPTEDNRPKTAFDDVLDELRQSKNGFHDDVNAMANGMSEKIDTTGSNFMETAKDGISDVMGKAEDTVLF